MAAPDPNPVRRRARARRRAELVAGWAAVVVLVVVLLLGGPWFLIVLLLALGAAVAANTVAAVKGRVPEETALTPGRLARATADRDPVSVTASWAPRRGAADRQRRDGRLTWSDGRLSFTVSGEAPRRGAPDQLAGVTLFDAEPWELRLGPAPTLLHPQLVLEQGDTTHVVELTAGWDIATVGVGVLVAGEWHRQLVEVGVPLDEPSP